MFPAVVTTNDRLRGERVDTMNQEEEKCWPQYKGGWVDDTPKNRAFHGAVLRAVLRPFCPSF